MQAISRYLSGPIRTTEHRSSDRLAFVAANPPKLHQRPLPSASSRWMQRQQANYYFDAGQQTSKAFRVLLSHCQQDKNPLNRQSHDALLMMSTHSLLASLKPGFKDDVQSRRHYLQLCGMHLSGLNATEIDQMQASLKQSKFDCYVTESIIDDEIYQEYGFSNGPPHCQRRTLLQTPDFYHLLDELKEVARSREAATNQQARLSAAQAQEVRDVLADAAGFWMQSDKSLAVMQDAACRLAIACAVGLPTETIAAELPSSSSTAGWHQGRLLIQPQVFLILQSAQNPQLHARVLRDILELLLTQKFTGSAAHPEALAAHDRHNVLHAIEQVSEQCMPSVIDATMRQQAAAVMRRAAQFGQIQIKPGTGSLLGHAWIAPDLSLVPNNLSQAKEIGRRFMHTGFQLQPGETTIREWPARFLTTKENADIHPDESAWQIRVPAPAIKLQAAANEVMQEWQENKIPYRFTGTDAGMPATGCRMVVWHAVQKSLDADALALFRRYNLGLAEPDSPTELAIRLQGFADWIGQLAKH